MTVDFSRRIEKGETAEIGQGYTKNNCFAYYKREKLEDSDGETFKVLQRGYAKDKLNAYYHGKKLEGTDGKLFQYLRDYRHNNSTYYYAGDKQSIFYNGVKLERADGESFEFLGSGYARDKHRAYLNGKKIKNSDGQTFELLEDNFQHFAMPRLARSVFAGAPHHLPPRDNRRGQVFFSDDDRHFSFDLSRSKEK